MMNDAKDIDLKTDILYEGSDTYVSVTDLYNVNIFTNEFMKIFQENKDIQKKYYENIEQSIFLDEKKAKGDEDGSETLFLEAVDLSKKQDVSDQQSHSVMNQILIGMMAFIIFVLFMIQYSLRRAVRRKKYADKDIIFGESKQN